MSKSASFSEEEEDAADTAVAALFASAFLPSSPILAASDLEEEYEEIV